jgi:NADH-quinone oxidoreductase subunit J
LAAVIGVGIMGIIIAAIVVADDVLVERGAGLASTTVDNPDGNIRQLARSIFSDNVFAFELTSVLLLVAVVGTILMARRVKSNGAGK